MFESLVEAGIIEVDPDTKAVRVHDRSAGRLLAAPRAVALAHRRAGPPGPREPHLRAGRAHPGRVHPRGPRLRAAPAARRAEGPEDRRDEGGGHRVRGAHGRAREARVPQAPARVRLRDVQRVPPRAPLGPRRRRPPEVDRARDGRALHGLQRVRPRVRARSRRGHAPAVPERRVQGAGPDGAGPGEDARGRGDRGLPARDGARGRLEPARRVGADAEPRGPGDEGGRDRDERRARTTSRATRKASRCSFATPCSSCCAPRAAGTGPLRRRWCGAARPRRSRARSRPFYRGAPVDPPRSRPRAPRTGHASRQEPSSWEVVQVVSDRRGRRRLGPLASIDLAASREAAAPVVTLQRVSR